MMTADPTDHRNIVEVLLQYFGYQPARSGERIRSRLRRFEFEVAILSADDREELFWDACGELGVV
jgi:hypothetical protein